MVTINITRKDSCENARMCVSVTALDRHSRCTLGQTRATPRCTPTL